ncbi:MAG: hypothetical protein OXI87_03945 [Albidovulum sp.]|nr:hypothetical protein [Albidovulum sp.]MDE0529969.1 hypothetical protein [Albidovulum sp.]
MAKHHSADANSDVAAEEFVLQPGENPLNRGVPAVAEGFEVDVTGGAA